MPPFYLNLDDQIGYNYVFPAYIPYFDPYFSFHLGDTLYSLDEEIEDIPLDFIPRHINKNKLVFVDDFKIIEDYLYILTSDEQDLDLFKDIINIIFLKRK